MMIFNKNKSSQRRTANSVSKIVTLIVATSTLVLTVGLTASAASNRYTPTQLGLGAVNAETSFIGGIVNQFRHGPTHRPPVGTSTTTTTDSPATTTTTDSPTTTTTTDSSATTTTVAPTTTTTDSPTTTTTDGTATTTTVVPTTTTTVSSGPQPAGNIPGSWNLVFDSEFTGSSLDTSQWSTGWFGSGITQGVNSLEEECMDPSQVVVSGGSLNLTAISKSETCGGVTQPFTSGMVTTDGKFSFTYGFMEAKIWLPGTSSISDWPAFWADGQSWPTDGENDVVEGLAGLAQAHFHDSAGADGPLTGTGSFTGGWHTFAADWEPGSVTYYYDGIDIGKFTAGVTGAPMYLILDLATSGPASQVVTPATMKVAYVRVWQH